MKEEKYNFAERFVDAMRIRGKKQKDIVRITGIDRGTISNYATGKYVPKSEKIKKIAEALEVSEAFLLGYTDQLRPLTAQEELLAWFDYHSDPSLPPGTTIFETEEIDIIKHYRLADDKTKKAVRIMLGVEE